MGKENRQFWESASMNNATFLQYYNRLVELNVSMFEWKNLPESIDPRFLELVLFSDGRAIFFKDEVLGELALRCTIGSNFDVYHIPIKRRAYASNGYNRDLDNTNSILIYNNYMHTPSKLDVQMYAKRLYKLDRVIDTNTNAQKTPIMITCEEGQYLTMKNLYMKYDGDVPVIYGDKNMNPNALKVLQTGAPYVSDKLYDLKMKYWNECLSFAGVDSVNGEKRERLITSEVDKAEGSTIANRFSKLAMRQKACEEINKMFGLNISCEYRGGNGKENNGEDGTEVGGAGDE